MTKKKLTTDRAAEILKVHPRTVMRAVTGEQNPVMQEEVDPEDVRTGFGITVRLWRRIMNGKDEFLTRDDIKARYSLSETTFKRRKYAPAARFNRIRRYSEVETGHHSAKFAGRDSAVLAGENRNQLSEIL